MRTAHWWAAIKTRNNTRSRPQINSACIVSESPLTNQWPIKVAINPFVHGNISALVLLTLMLTIYVDCRTTTTCSTNLRVSRAIRQAGGNPLLVANSRHCVLLQTAKCDNKLWSLLSEDGKLMLYQRKSSIRHAYEKLANLH